MLTDVTPLQPFYSILSAELYAIYKAINYAIGANLKRVLIVSDSLSSLNRLNNPLLFKDNPVMIYNILKTVFALRTSPARVDFDFLWIPSHSNIKGNDYVDSVSKAVNLNSDRLYTSLTALDFKDNILKPDLYAWCALHWPYTDKDVSNKTYFQKTPFKSDNPWFSKFTIPRKWINAVSRLRSGHTYTQDTFSRLHWTLTLDCNCGATRRTLRHILFDCPIYSSKREELFAFLKRRVPNMDPNSAPIYEVIFPPDEEAVKVLGSFFCLDNNFI